MIECTILCHIFGMLHIMFGMIDSFKKCKKKQQKTPDDTNILLKKKINSVRFLLFPTKLDFMVIKAQWQGLQREHRLKN